MWVWIFQNEFLFMKFRLALQFSSVRPPTNDSAKVCVLLVTKLLLVNFYTPYVWSMPKVTIKKIKSKEFVQEDCEWPPILSGVSMGLLSRFAVYIKISLTLIVGRETRFLFLRIEARQWHNGQVVLAGDPPSLLVLGAVSGILSASA